MYRTTNGCGRVEISNKICDKPVFASRFILPGYLFAYGTNCQTIRVVLLLDMLDKGNALPAFPVPLSAVFFQTQPR